MSSASSTTLPKFRAKKYHRRSFWACDECKLRKKKCDGAQPCTTCNQYGKDCTYDSKTRPSQPPTHKIRELEEDIRRVRTLLLRVRGDLNGDALADVDAMLTKLRPAAEEPALMSSPTMTDKSAAESLQSMLTARDRLFSDGDRNLSHGPYSGPAIILSVVEFFQPSLGGAVIPEIIHMFDARNSWALSQPLPVLSSHGLDLVAKSDAFEVLNVVLMQSHPFLQSLDAGFLHSLFKNAYDAIPGSQFPVDNASLCLCHIVLALGYLMSVVHHRRFSCDWAIMKAKFHFDFGCRLIDLSNCDNMMHLQIILSASAFLTFMSHLSTAYTYVHVAAVSAVKQGLLTEESSASTAPHPYGMMGERTVAVLINIDLYLSAVLGLPHAVPDSVTDKKSEQWTIEAGEGISGLRLISDGESATAQSLSILKRNFDIVSLTASVLRTFGESTACRGEESTQGTGIDEAVLRNAGKDLSRLSRDVGLPLTSSAINVGGYVATRSSLARCESEFTLYWSQLSIHLPFLHYLRPLADGHPIPDAASRPALTCLKLAVNVIVRCESLLQSLSDSDTYSQFIHPSNWTCIYTLFLAVLVLVFLISIHEGTSKPSEAWRKADTGIRILAALRCGDNGAIRCLAVIKKVVYQLNYTVDFDFDEIERTTRRVCESQTKLPTLSNILSRPEGQENWQARDRDTIDIPQPATVRSGVLSMSTADEMLARAQNIRLRNDSMNNELEGVG